MTGNTSAGGNTKDVERIIPLKYLSNISKTLEMSIVNLIVKLITF